MRVAILNVPYRLPADPSQWITVPPQGYGGIQWVVANLIDGLIHTGFSVSLLGAPGSQPRDGLDVVPAVNPAQTQEWLDSNQVDIVHDHSNGQMLSSRCKRNAVVSTFHLTGRPTRPVNCVYVSRAQRRMAGSQRAPVIRLPVNPDRYLFRRAKHDYLIFLGRVSEHKGVWEAAAFAAASGLPLKVAGPSWEADYLARVLADFPGTVEYLGEVGGADRVPLIANARAVLVMSQPVKGPFGTAWVEPGATVVSEAAVCGTPIVATDNGCLREIVPGVGRVLDNNGLVTSVQASRTLESLPSADAVRDVAVDRWGHIKIAAQYVEVYERAGHFKNWV